MAAAAVLWAAGGAVASHVIELGAAFVELTEARAWITAAALGVVLFLRARRRGGEPPGRAPWALVVLFGLSIAGANFTYYASLSLLPVAVAITVQYTAPALVVVWVAVADRAAPSRGVIGALALTLAGVVLLAELPDVVSGRGLRLSAAGIALSIAAAVAFAVYIVTGEHLGRRLRADVAVFRGFLVASVLWIVVQVVRGRPDTLLDARFVPWVVFLAVVTTIAPFLLFVWGMEGISASRAGIMSTLEPLTAALIAFVWLGQSLSPWQIAGATMVLVGVGIVRLERPEDREMLAERAALE